MSDDATLNIAPNRFRLQWKDRNSFSVSVESRSRAQTRLPQIRHLMKQERNDLSDVEIPNCWPIFPNVAVCIVKPQIGFATFNQKEILSVDPRSTLLKPISLSSFYVNARPNDVCDKGGELSELRKARARHVTQPRPCLFLPTLSVEVRLKSARFLARLRRHFWVTTRLLGHAVHEHRILSGIALIIIINWDTAGYLLGQRLF